MPEDLFITLHKKRELLIISSGERIHCNVPTIKQRSQANFILNNFKLYCENPKLVSKMYNLLTPLGGNMILNTTDAQLIKIRKHAEQQT